MLDDRISALIARVYEGAVDARAWDQALAELLIQTDSQSVLVCPTDLHTGELFQPRYHGSDAGRRLDTVRDYVAELYQSDPMLQFGLRHPHAGVVRLSTALPGDDADENDFVRWIRSQLDIREYVVRYTPPRDGFALALALVPRAGQDAHRAEELRLFNLVFDHIAQAARIAARLPRGALTDSPDAVLMLDRRGRVLDMSDAARALLARDATLTVEDGLLRTARRDEQGRVDMAIQAALDAFKLGSAGGDLSLQREQGRRPLLLWISALPQDRSPFGWLRPAAMVRIVDPDLAMPASAQDRWARMFGLTPAETRLAATLLAGEANLRTAADALGIAYSTARVQLASLFDKTGVRSQAQLARLLTRCEA